MEIPAAGKLFLGGSLGALAGAVGVVRLGTASYLLFRDALVLRPGDPLPDSLQYCGGLALYSLLFGASTLAALIGLLQLTREAPFSSLALILLIASGAASAAGGAGLWMGASRELASLRVVVASAASPQPDQVSAAVEHALGPARVGFAGLLAGSGLLLVLSCGSLKGSSRSAPPNVAARVVCGLAAASVMGFALVLAATWFPMHELTIGFDAGHLQKPGELARSIYHTLQLSQLAAALLLIYGVFTVLLGILVRRGSRRASFEP